MPQLDMPLEKLKNYQGRNPRPADFDEFWDRGLAEIAAIDPHAEWIPNDYPSAFAECGDLWFTSTKGARIHARYAKPKQITGKIPAVLRFHGLSGASSSFRTLLAYASLNALVVMMDCRGQGGLSEDVGGVAGTTYTTPFVRGLDGTPDGLYCRDVFLDTALLARIVMNLGFVDAGRVGVCGGSQGGGLSLACAALVPEIKLCAPTYPYMSDYKRVWEMDLDKGAYEGLRYYFRWFDPLHEKEDEIFEKLGYVDVQFLAPRIRAKVQMSTALLDNTCPPSTQFAAYNKITSEKKMLIYPDFNHESLNGGEDEEFRFLAQL